MTPFTNTHRLILESLYAEFDKRARRLEPHGGDESRITATAIRAALDVLAPRFAELRADGCGPGTSCADRVERALLEVDTARDFNAHPQLVHEALTRARRLLIGAAAQIDPGPPA